MKKIMCKIWGFTACPVAGFTLILGVSITALAAALLSEILLGLEPCRLCIHQRWGFVAAALFALIGLLLRKRPKGAASMAALSGLSFLATSAIAAYHTGVEQKWWVSAVEGCSVPSGFSTQDPNWMENLMATPSARCDEIPWQDPLIGLSMANYNIILCLGMFVICLIGAVRMYRKTP